MLHRMLCSTAIAAAMIACLPDFASGRGHYTLSRFDTSDAPLNGLEPYEPHLNNRGQVAYRAGRYAVLGDQLYGFQDIDGQRLQGVIDSPYATMSLNNAGELAFYANRGAAGIGIFTTDRFAFGGPFGPFLNPITLNDTGQISYEAPAGSTGDTSVYVDRTLVAGPGTVIGGRTLNNAVAPSLNNRGQVAYIGVYVDGGGGIFLDDAFLLGRGSVIDGRTLFFAFGPSLNDDGQVAFLSTFDAGGFGIFTDDRFVAGVGSTIDGRTITNTFSFLDINNRGQVAYGALINGGEGIFVDDRFVAGTGTTVGGLTIAGVRRLYDFNTPSINDRGDLAFWARFTDGTSGIVLAHPVPEPSSLAMLGLGIAASATFAARRNRVRRS